MSKDPINLYEQELNDEQKKDYNLYMCILKDEINLAFDFAKQDLQPNQDLAYKQVFSEYK